MNLLVVRWLTEGTADFFRWPSGKEAANPVTQAIATRPFSAVHPVQNHAR